MNGFLSSCFVRYAGADDDDDSDSRADKKLQNRHQDLLSPSFPLSPASPKDSVNAGSAHSRPHTVHEGAFQRMDRKPLPRKHNTDARLKSSTSNGQIGMPSYLSCSVDSSLSAAAPGGKNNPEHLPRPGYYESPRPGSPSRRDLERKLPKSITLANANPPKVETINPIGIHRYAGLGQVWAGLGSSLDVDL